MGAGSGFPDRGGQRPNGRTAGMCPHVRQTAKRKAVIRGRKKMQTAAQPDLRAGRPQLPSRGQAHETDANGNAIG